VASDPSYFIVYRPEVVDEDLPGIPANVRSKILAAIERRLGADPTRYGQRLRRSLRGLWKLRVRDYRVCYQIEGNTVIVWAVRHRREVYAVAESRRR